MTIKKRKFRNRREYEAYMLRLKNPHNSKYFNYQFEDEGILNFKHFLNISQKEYECGEGEYKNIKSKISSFKNPENPSDEEVKKYLNKLSVKHLNDMNGFMAADIDDILIARPDIYPIHNVSVNYNKAPKDNLDQLDEITLDIINDPYSINQVYLNNKSIHDKYSADYFNSNFEDIYPILDEETKKKIRRELMNKALHVCRNTSDIDLAIDYILEETAKVIDAMSAKNITCKSSIEKNGKERTKTINATGEKLNKYIQDKIIGEDTESFLINQRCDNNMTIDLSLSKGRKEKIDIKSNS